MFMRMNFHSGLPGDSTFAKRSSLDGMWNDLSAEQKVPYNAAADDENKRADAYVDENFNQFLERHASQSQTPAARKTARFHAERARAIQNTVPEILHHDVFRGGLGMYDYDSGIRADLVRRDLSRAEIQERLHQLFRYDRRPVPNPAGPMTHFEPCSQRHGGLYETVCDLCSRADTLTINMYIACRDSRKQFPLLLEFEVRGAPPVWHYVFLGRLIGTGQLAFVSEAVWIDERGRGRGR